jgi:flagellar hook-length control protein FliK
MALTLDSVLKSQESSAKGAANPRRTVESKGEAFSETLKLIQTARSDSDPAAASEPERSPGMPPLLPVETNAAALPVSGDAPLEVSSDTSEASVTADGPESAPAETGSTELETDRERALSHEEAVQAEPPLVAVPPVVAPMLAADAEPEMLRAAVPASTPSIPTNAVTEASPATVVETIGTVVAATASAQEDEATEDAVLIDAPNTVVSGSWAASKDVSKHRDEQSADTSAAKPAPVTDADPANTAAILAAPAVTATRQDSNGGTEMSAQTAPAASMAISGQATVQTTAPAAPLPAALTPTHAMLVASPAEVVDIVSSAADDGQTDRIVVQLDPPELGRVSIDFKFDANGLQHVTVTGESPEAVRQLRLMHFELTQALERHGITSQNMSFQQQQNAQDTPLPYASKRESQFGVPESKASTGPLIAANSLPSPRTLPGGRLDMKL